MTLHFRTRIYHSVAAKKAYQHFESLFYLVQYYDSHIAHELYHSMTARASYQRKSISVSPLLQTTDELYDSDIRDGHTWA